MSCSNAAVCLLLRTVFTLVVNCDEYTTVSSAYGVVDAQGCKLRDERQEILRRVCSGEVCPPRGPHEERFAPATKRKRVGGPVFYNPRAFNGIVTNRSSF